LAPTAGPVAVAEAVLGLLCVLVEVAAVLVEPPFVLVSGVDEVVAEELVEVPTVLVDVPGAVVEVATCPTFEDLASLQLRPARGTRARTNGEMKVKIRIKRLTHEWTLGAYGVSGEADGGQADAAIRVRRGDEAWVERNALLAR
jgi:hypothetical protein